MKARLLLLVLLLAAGVPVSAGEVYSWTDANGVQHFSDSPPPPNVNARKLKVRGSFTSQEGDMPAVVADATPKPADTVASTGGAAKPLVDSPENRAKQCQMARSNLALLQSSYQVSAPAGQEGNAQVLDEAGRKQAVDRATDQVAFYCK
jgi:hypothetical protein